VLEALLGEIALVQAISPIVAHISAEWSVFCYTCTPCLSHSTDLNAICQVHLQGPVTHCVSPSGKADLGVECPSQNLHLPTYDLPGGSTEQRFHVLSNYFGHLLVCVVQLFSWSGLECLQKTWHRWPAMDTTMNSPCDRCTSVSSVQTNSQLPVACSDDVNNSASIEQPQSHHDGGVNTWSCSPWQHGYDTAKKSARAGKCSFHPVL